MEIRLIEAVTHLDFESPELRKRAQESSKSIKTTHYRAIANTREVAFVSLDRWPELGHMVLYEIFIAKKLRRQGIGSDVLAEVESTAIKEEVYVMRLRPKPLDEGISQQELDNWYARRGYAQDSTITGEMQKNLINRA
jgi:GNAT superfamily N-acetyltransferase